MGQPFDPNQPPPGWAPGPAAHAPATGPMNAPVPPDRQSPYAPSAAPGPSPRKPWGPAAIGLVIGLVIAVAVGGVLAATKKLHFGTVAAATADTRTITLPQSVNGYQDLVAANKALLAGSSSASTRQSTIVASQQANQAKVKSLTVAAYQAAYDGAAVDVHGYADAKLEHFVTVIAVRAGSPGLTLGPVTDAAYLGLAVNQQEVKAFGDVDCRVAHTNAVPAGKTVDPADQITTVCQRSAGALTVQVFGSAFDGADGQQAMVSLTNAAWAAVAG